MRVELGGAAAVAVALAAAAGAGAANVRASASGRSNFTRTKIKRRRETLVFNFTRERLLVRPSRAGARETSPERSLAASSCAALPVTGYGDKLTTRAADARRVIGGPSRPQVGGIPFHSLRRYLHFEIYWWRILPGDRDARPTSAAGIDDGTVLRCEIPAGPKVEREAMFAPRTVSPKRRYRAIGSYSFFERAGNQLNRHAFRTASEWERERERESERNEM